MVDLKSQLKPQDTKQQGNKEASASPASKETVVSKERIFHCSAPSMHFTYDSKGNPYGKKASFKHNFLFTDDPEIIDFVKANFIDKKSYFSVKEVNRAFYDKATTLPAVPVVIEPLPSQESSKAELPKDTENKETTGLKEKE